MRKRISGRRRRGAVLVEAAMVVMVFLILIFGMLDLGVGVFRHHVVSQAARQGVRRAIVHGKLAPPTQAAWGPAAHAGTADLNNDIANAIRPFLAGLDPSRVTIAADWLDGDNDVEDRVRVTVSTTWQPLMLFIFGSNPFTLSASSTMPIAH